MNGSSISLACYNSNSAWDLQKWSCQNIDKFDSWIKIKFFHFKLGGYAFDACDFMCIQRHANVHNMSNVNVCVQILWYTLFAWYLNCMAGVCVCVRTNIRVQPPYMVCSKMVLDLLAYKCHIFLAICMYMCICKTFYRRRC